MASVNRVSRFGFVNCYLVDEDDGFTLVDTMLPRSGKAITQAAAQLGKPIKRIALTHAHGDHVGSLDELTRKLGEVEVLISTRDARLLAGEKTLDPAEPQDKLRGGYPGADTKPTRTLSPGDRVGSLEVVASPGHTPGHVAFVDTRDGTLYCGDVFVTRGGVATTAELHWKFPFATMATWHRPTEVDSARALRALDPPRLAPGHGPVVDSPGAQMDAAIARAS